MFKKSEGRRNALFVVTMVLMTIYLLWRLLFTLPVHDGPLNMACGILLLIAETVTVTTTFELLIQKMRLGKSSLELPDILPEDYPDIDVLIATHDEDVALLRKTVNACTFMDYPDKRKVHIFLCDDGNRPEMASLATDFGIGYLGLADNTHAKSGNYNNALAHTTSPLVATFDADMIPRHTFLMRTVPYFLLSRYEREGAMWQRRETPETDPAQRIGLVQTPQSFYNPDLFQFNLYAEGDIPNEQDFFSREINVMRNTSNAIAYTGSNTVILRQALDDIGGFPYETITEDFETSVRIQQEGYVTYATSEVQAAGLSVTTIDGLIGQRVRWGRGIIHSLQNTHAIVSSKLPLKARVTYLNSFLYWWSFFNRLVFILAPILFALFGFRIVNAGLMPIIIVWLPSYFFYSIAMRFLSSDIRNQRWSQVVDTILMPYLIVPVFLETIHVHARKFRVTRKDAGTTTTRLRACALAIPTLALFVLSSVALASFVWGKYGMALLQSSIIIFWISYNAIALLYALFFMLGRPVHRSSARIAADEYVIVHGRSGDHEARTADMSDAGLALLSEEPLYVPDDRQVSLTISTSRYEADMTASLVYVHPRGDKWLYAFSVTPESEQDGRQYLQIVYDRPHSLPERMNLWDTAWDDIVRNVRRRLARERTRQRKSPRISIDRTVTFADGTSCTLVDFNYHFLAVKGLDGDGHSGDAYVYVMGTGTKLSLRVVGPAPSRPGLTLLKVENLTDLEESGLINVVADDFANRIMSEEA